MNFFQPNFADKSVANRIYISSDFHAYHRNLCAGSSDWSDKSMCRPFEDQYEMTDCLVDNINETVPKDGILFHLGDWSFGGRDKIKTFRDRIECRTIVHILGNHDHHILNNTKFEPEYDHSAQDCFDWIGHYNEFRYKKIKIVMSHYPIASWNEIGRGSLMLHGHCHHSLPSFGRRVDVGIDGPDYDFKPLKLTELFDKLTSIPIQLVDHHDENTLYGR